jgi:hypothetical protein
MPKYTRRFVIHTANVNFARLFTVDLLLYNTKNYKKKKLQKNIML